MDYQRSTARLDAITFEGVVRLLTKAGVKTTDPITDITDALYEWGIDHGYDEEAVTEFAMDWSQVAAS